MRVPLPSPGAAVQGRLRLIDWAFRRAEAQGEKREVDGVRELVLVARNRNKATALVTASTFCVPVVFERLLERICSANAGGSLLLELLAAATKKGERLVVWEGEGRRWWAAHLARSGPTAADSLVCVCCQ